MDALNMFIDVVGGLLWFVFLIIVAAIAGGIELMLREAYGSASGRQFKDAIVRVLLGLLGLATIVAAGYGVAHWSGSITRMLLYAGAVVVGLGLGLFEEQPKEKAKVPAGSVSVSRGSATTPSSVVHTQTKAKPAQVAHGPKASVARKRRTKKPELSSGERWLQLVGDIASGDYEARDNAVEELGRDPDKKRAVNFLVNYVREHPRWEVRVAAARALGEIGDQSAAQDLVALYTEAVGTHDYSVSSQLPFIVGALDQLGWRPGPGGWRRSS